MPTPRPNNRPNHPWRCGLEVLGDSCTPGPCANGSCPKASECVPIRQGDRWLCNRSDARGGPCDHETPGGGPTPDGACCLQLTCKPRRSLRALRADWIACAIVLAAGVGMLLFGSTRRNEWLVPGPLTEQHAAVVARDATRCIACHPNANDNFSDLVTQATFGDSSHETILGEKITQSTLCLECHREFDTLGANPLLAHGLARGELGEHATGRAVDCAVCHQEHHGAMHDLTALSDARCQACHQQTYLSFATDHPDFGLWPTERRTRIAFNHASHSGEHFTKANRAFDCASCHTTDATGDLTARVEYAAACADCHEADLRKSFEQGVALVALPMLDAEVLAEIDRPLDTWPAAALGDFDGDAPPLMKLLLASDPAANEVMGRLGADFSFFDIDPDSPADAADAATLAASLRSLLDELQEEGHGNLEYRLRSLLGTTLPEATVAELVGGLPVEFIDQVQEAWFGGGARPAEYDAVDDRRTAGGWLVDHDRLEVRYRPSGHDDPFLRAWLDVVAALPAEHAELRDACLAEFSRTGSPGACLSCHSVDRTKGHQLTINWRGRDRLDEPRGFTHFSHRPHLVQPELSGCTHCHTIDPSADLAPSYASTDPGHATPQFVALTKSTCVECHRPHAAGDSCTQCHNYHVAPGAGQKFTTEPQSSQRDVALRGLETR